ncbi:Right handed beta helix region [Syntrophus gentianae]|uniref:Right handed beta helix region n=1 Tax=Syntrophus gentianae TaxID=43775 RepID=A0A1H8BGV0_9BACT|nr:NosD domain-containing protein [Syntrophus gentianae]SEM81354.1 Right handed beta helix region [Syntrophus gentianae]
MIRKRYLSLVVALALFGIMAVVTAPAFSQAVVLTKKEGSQFQYSTIQSAVNNALPGDTIVIPDGVWHERVYILNKGNSTDPITIMGTTRNGCIIDGGLNLASATWIMETLNGQEFLVTTFTHSLSTLAAWDADGTRIWTYGSAAEITDNTGGKPPEGVWYDRVNQKIYAKGFDPVVAGITVSEYDNSVTIDKSTNIKLANLTVKNGGASSLKITESTDITVQNVNVKGGRHGITISNLAKTILSSRIRIDGCNITETYNPEWWVSDFKSDTTAPMEGVGIWIVSAGDDNVVTNCEVTGFLHGISAQSDADENNVNNNLEISYNRVHETAEGLGVDSVCFNCRVFSNTLYNVYTGISFSPAWGPLYVYRNVVINDRYIRFNRATTLYMYGLGLKIGWSARPSQDVNIYNNTFISGKTTVGCGMSTTNGVAKNFKFYNNIFYSKTIDVVHASGAPEDGFFYDHNLYYSRTSSPLIIRWKKTLAGETNLFNSLVAAMVATSNSGADWEANGINADPMLKGLSEYPCNVSLLSGSPAIGKGKNIKQLGWPDSLNVEGGQYNIGASQDNTVMAPSAPTLLKVASF